MDFATIVDIPLALAADGDAPPVTRHPVAKLGRYKDPRYGRFAITEADYLGWVKNLRAAQNGRIPIDYDHLAERQGGSTKAAGWITDLQLEGDKVMGQIEWTPDGAEAIRNRYYLFVSPSFVRHLKGEDGADLGPALLGVALTNRPFLAKGMPALSLSKLADELANTISLSVEGLSEGIGFAESEASDSPRRMADSPYAKIAEALSLSADADEDAIVAAIAEATKAPEETKTLTEQAESEGKVVLSRDEVTELQADAKRGKEAAEELLENKFELAFGKALDEGRIDAAEETKTDWHALYEAAPDVTLARLSKLPALVRTTGRSSGHSLSVAPEFEGQEVDSEMADIDAKAVELSKAESIPYEQAVDRVLAEVAA